MKPEAHGGDLLRMAATAGRDPASLLDFSVNVRPEGPPEFIRAALFRAMTALAAYPSPHAEEAMLAAAGIMKWTLPASSSAAAATSSSTRLPACSASAACLPCASSSPHSANTP